jgi:hypothetical protein
VLWKISKCRAGYLDRLQRAFENQQDVLLGKPASQHVEEGLKASLYSRDGMIK